MKRSARLPDRDLLAGSSVAVQQCWKDELVVRHLSLLSAE
jgi:hypothetical protein